MTKLTQALVADHLDLSQPAVSKMIADGVLPRIAPSLTFDDYRTPYIRHLREQAAGRAAGTDDEGEPDLVRERALLAREQRHGQAMKNAVLRGELLPVDDVEAVIGAVTDAIRSKLLAIPTKGAPLCAEVAGLLQMRSVLSKLVDEALADLASSAVVVATVVERARRRIGRWAARDTLDGADEAAAKPDLEPMV